ncbi:MAG: beta galactosidase jelly roll domain-containing protein, partial [Armatimonadota bacterium]|nr:beta galactosidase jelly roll domain-containing protein [Armatimonadota bacterium]
MNHKTKKTAIVAMMAIGVLGALTSPILAATPAPRQHILLDADWRFLRGALPGVPDEAGTPVTGWRWKTGTVEDTAFATADLNAADWAEATVGEDVFHGQKGFAWYRTTLPNVAGKTNVILHFTSVDDNATVYVNGKEMKHHAGWDDAFDVPLDSVWRAGGPNTVAVLVENTAAAGGIAGTVTVSAGPEVAPAPAQPNFNDRAWRRVHLPHDFVIEGTFDPKGNAGHGALPTDVGWYRKTFTLPASDRGKVLWLDFDGIYRNSTIWLNGRQIGKHACGYSPFHIDVSQTANYGGTNTLTVRCDARAQ